MVKISLGGTVEARFVYVFILGIFFTGTKDLLRSQIVTADAKLRSRGLWEIYSGLVLLVTLLFRAHNLPVLCCCLLIQTLMAQFIWKKLHYDAAQTTIMHYWFGQAFFYFQSLISSSTISELRADDHSALCGGVLKSRHVALLLSFLAVCVFRRLDHSESDSAAFCGFIAGPENQMVGGKRRGGVYSPPMSQFVWPHEE
ncbi:GPI ethanolamine phosphate transferase 2 [Liparis tanakae]|uniref:GPI ethanolamine phosphate transferase 2 n=1 Tax=Liparis tanakae TaxID=230148 RepID=A0A4Z2HIZ9_9TELE|nr:GPI ethanolamine phosphate transferase 2 [Liparis tanakae]